MQLYVLGPAFGLPAIDAECIASIAVLQLQSKKTWEIIPTFTTDPPLPLLVDGKQRTTGFRNIARYVEDVLSTDVAISKEKDRANSIAISSFLESSAQALIDISLYVSFENYRHATRPAFSKILPWHANYIIPPKLRAEARKRTEHLGVASIDVDDVHEDMSNRPDGFDGVGKQEGFEKHTQQRASLLLPRKDTIRSFLRQPQHAAAFKLHALAENFFAPLEELLGKKDYLLGSELNTLDCLAYGYLSLMLYPAVPQDWLASTMRKKYKKLAEYTQRVHDSFNMGTREEDVIAMAKLKTVDGIADYQKSCQMVLPWNPPLKPTINDFITSTSLAILSHIPIFGTSATIVPAKSKKRSFWQEYFPVVLGITATSAIAGLYYSFKTGLLIWPHGEQVQIFGRKRFDDYGHLGAALAGISLLGQQADRDAAFHQQEQLEDPVHVDVSLEGR